MTEQLAISVTRVPSDLALGSDPSVLVVPIEGGGTTVDLYRRFGTAPALCGARERLAAIVSTRVLNTPDQVGATGRRSDGSTFLMDLDIGRFAGSIDANDQWIGLVRMELGALEPGPYRLNVRETVRRFTDRSHPELGTDPTVTEQNFSFRCA